MRYPPNTVSSLPILIWTSLSSSLVISFRVIWHWNVHVVTVHVTPDPVLSFVNSETVQSYSKSATSDADMNVTYPLDELWTCAPLIAR